MSYPNGNAAEKCRYADAAVDKKYYTVLIQLYHVRQKIQSLSLDRIKQKEQALISILMLWLLCSIWSNKPGTLDRRRSLRKKPPLALGCSQGGYIFDWQKIGLINQ